MKKTVEGLVSIIVPVYNVERYVARCLDSICSQTYRHIEILAVYYDSDDNSEKICEEYTRRDTRIKLVYEQQQGLGPARDKGIELAQGEWLCFVDSDDYIHPQYVELLLDTVKKAGCLTAQCRYERVWKWGEDFDRMQARFQLMDWRNYFIYLYEHVDEGYTPFGVWANIYHHTLFKNVRFGPARYAEDSGFTPEIIYAASTRPIAVLDNVLYYYFQREGSLLHSKTSLVILDRFVTKSRAMKFWESKKEEEMLALFFDDFFNCMILDYINLCIELPDEYDNYAFLKEEIKKNYERSALNCNGELCFHPASGKIWKSFCQTGRQFVLYGFGMRGREVLQWMRILGLPVIEIWDQKADGNDDIEGIPFRKSHYGLKEDVMIIIAIENRFTAYSVRCALRDMGYQNFTDYYVWYAAMRYGKYKKFLPFLVEGYEGLHV